MAKSQPQLLRQSGFIIVLDITMRRVIQVELFELEQELKVPRAGCNAKGCWTGLFGGERENEDKP